MSVNVKIEEGQPPVVTTTVDPPAPPVPPAPPSPTIRVKCKDGTESQSGNHSGACAWHGGVDWS